MDKKIQPLFDGDILLHEIGWSTEFRDKDTKENILLDAEHAETLLKDKIKSVCYDVEATEPPVIYLSDSEWIAKKQKRSFVKGKRYELAKTRPYKGNRVNPKPFHFYNLTAIMLADYDTVVATDGYEADDLLCRDQYTGLQKNSPISTIICSRDKDVRICPGWHYSWECGQQRAIGPVETDEIGWLEKRENGDVLGYGLSFFYYQCLVGDTADYIPGLPGWGKAGAFNLLSELKTKEDLFKAVKTAYKDQLGEQAKTYFNEQASLLWMYMDKDIVNGYAA